MNRTYQERNSDLLKKYREMTYEEMTPAERMDYHLALYRDVINDPFAQPFVKGNGIFKQGPIV